MVFKKWEVPAGTGKKSWPHKDTIIKCKEVINRLSMGTLDPKTGKYRKIPLNQACEEAGIHYYTFYRAVNNSKALKKAYNEIEEVRKSTIKWAAEENLVKAMNREGEYKWMEAKDTARLSLDVLKSLDKGYNPKIEVENTGEVTVANISKEEILKRIEELKNM